MNWRFWRKKTKVKKRRSVTREWLGAIIFAVIAAIIIRAFFVEAYFIPSGSMEGTLLVGDYLFVSKVNYGARMPITPIAFPFAQNTLPLFGTRSYWDGIRLPYFRLPGLGKIKRGDVIVFNYPLDIDSPLYRPVDKQENYIKRCVAIPGDTLSILHAQIYINSKPEANPANIQTSYLVQTDTTGISLQTFKKLQITVHGEYTFNYYDLVMSRESAAALKGYPNVRYLHEYLQYKGAYDADVFPHDPHLRWNADNYGPIIIPKKGWTVDLDSLNLPLYRRAIAIYENNKLQLIGHDIFINGKKPIPTPLKWIITG